MLFPRLQVVSDLHLEIEDNRSKVPEIPLCAPFLALCGDIGNPFFDSYAEFLKDVGHRFRQVFVVAGNHEFYNNEYFDTLRRLSVLCDQFPRVHFFDVCSQASFLDESSNIRFLGTTLWSRISGSDRIEKISRVLNDYSYIKWRPPDSHITRLYTVEDSNQLFEEASEYLRNRVDQAWEDGEVSCLISHHCPVRSDTVREGDHSVIEAFATDMNEFMGEKVTGWGYGHTHLSSDFILNGTHVFSNQCGYRFIDEETGFLPEKVIELRPRAEHVEFCQVFRQRHQEERVLAAQRRREEQEKPPPPANEEEEEDCCLIV